jgi:hypothetical protein
LISGIIENNPVIDDLLIMLLKIIPTPTIPSDGRIPIFPVMPPALDYACLPYVSGNPNALLYNMIVA